MDKHELIQSAVDSLGSFAKMYGIEGLFIIGGYCRSIYLDREDEIEDIDVVCAYHDQAAQLGGLFASEVLQSTPVYLHRTGTVSVEYKVEDLKIKIDFQGRSPAAYMSNEEIKTWFQANNIDDVPLTNNIYGRDFTINTLLYSLTSGQFFDPTQKAKEDLDTKLIRSILPPQMLMKYNPLAALRAIRFAIQYEFFIEKELRLSIQIGIDNLERSFTRERIVKEIIKIIEVDPKQGIEIIKKYQLNRFLLDKEAREILEIENNAEESTVAIAN